MGFEKLNKRLSDLEKVGRDEPIVVKWCWSVDEIPPEHRDSVIKLLWYDSV
jgi:hypothetical protein